MATLDLLFRGGAIAILVLMSAMFVFRQPNRWMALFGSLLFLGVAGYLLAPVLWESVGMPLWSVPFYFLGHSVTFFFWMFALSIFDDDFTPRWHHGAVFAVYVGLWFAQRYVTDAMGPSIFVSGQELTLEDDLFLIAHLVFLAVVVTTFLRVGSGISTDLVEGRRRLRGWAIALIGAYTLVVIAVEIAVRENTGAGLHMVNSASILVLNMVVAALALTLKPWGLTAPVGPKRAAPEPDSSTETEGLDRLMAFFESEKGHQREGLTIADVAEAIGLPEYRTRRLINQNLGFRNFNALLNEYRIRDACEALKDSEKRRLPVLTIALDVGYGSIGPFNRAFKAAMGMTPTEYRKSENPQNSAG